nr:hypothetical protein [Corynebacterium auriscanis]
MNTQQQRTAGTTLIVLIALLALLAVFNVIQWNAATWGIGSLIFLGILLTALQVLKQKK